MENDNNLVRINKFLSQHSELSRRKADEAIENGRVSFNGRPAVLGDMVGEGDEILLDGAPLEAEGSVNTGDRKVVIAFNKPLGQVCTSKDADRKSIFNLNQFPVKLYYVGRLDKDSQGLLLLTNDGDLANEIQRPRNEHEKEYIVRVDSPITNEVIDQMSRGVPILDTITRPCIIKRQGPNTFRIIIKQGLNRQIRRMCEYFGLKVTFLKRVRVMNISLGNLEPGEYRELTPKEEKQLRELLKRK